MKFNPRTKRLFTDEGQLIKKLHCPFQLDWSKLELTSDPEARLCSICRHKVSDTAHFSDEELQALVAENPQACLKVDLYQDNLTIIHHDEFQ